MKNKESNNKDKKESKMNKDFINQIGIIKGLRISKEHKDRVIRRYLELIN